MGHALTLTSAGALFIAMALLAAVPSVSVLAVSARAASHGFLSGAMTALGVVAGDVLFVLIAVFGLAFLVDGMGDVFVVVKYAGGLYLVWLGIRLWRARGIPSTHKGTASSGSLVSCFGTGLLITLADQKAVFFYLGFFPAFFEVSSLTAADVAIVLSITVAAVGGVKLVYAYAAERTSALVAKRARSLNAIAAGVMVLAGVVLLLRA